MPDRLPPWLDPFRRDTFEHGGKVRPYFALGDGPPVIVLHEAFGLTKEVAAFSARLVSRAAVSVYLPVLFGDPRTSDTKLGKACAFVQMCVSREFTLLALDRSSPAVDAVRALADVVLAARPAETRYGVIGLCITGNFALAMMCDTRLAAPVVSEPSSPFALTPSRKANPGVDPSALACAKARCGEPGSMLGFRFERDRVSPVERFDHLAAALAPGFERDDLPSPLQKPSAHAVFTADYDDTQGTRTRAAFDRIVEFLQTRL